MLLPFVHFTPGKPWGRAMKQKSESQSANGLWMKDTVLLMGFAYSQPLEDIASQLKRPVGDLIIRLTSFGMFPSARTDTVH